jgi:ribosomal protein S18 acetylase RimI-like enzyme
MIEEAREASAELVEALARLVPQLSSSAPAPNLETVQRLVDSDTAHLLVARDEDGRIVGTLTLVVFAIPTGIRAWVEDVIVDSAARGRGIGDALTREAVRIAAELGARTVDLTSRPSREAANRMYLRIGFAKRETSVYRYPLS